MVTPAILFAANPKAKALLPEEDRLGDVQAHINFLTVNKLKSINWNLIRNFRKSSALLDYYSKIQIGYIYNVPDKAVTYKCKVNWIKQGSEISEADREYYPEWRNNNPDKEWIVLNLSEFKRLEKVEWSPCTKFNLFSTSNKIKTFYVINYYIVESV